MCLDSAGVKSHETLLVFIIAADGAVLEGLKRICIILGVEAKMN